MFAVVAAMALVLGVLDQPALGQTATKPTGLTATADSATSVSLDWDDPTDSTITDYKIFRREGDSGSFTELDVDTVSAATSYTDDTVFGDTTYQYNVMAVNSGGDSVSSDNAEVRTPSQSVWTANVTVGSVTLPLDPDDPFVGYANLEGTSTFGTLSDTEFVIAGTTSAVTAVMYGFLNFGTDGLWFGVSPQVDDRFAIRVGNTVFNLADGTYTTGFYQIGEVGVEDDSPFPPVGETVSVELATSFPSVTVDTVPDDEDDVETLGVQSDALSVTEGATAAHTVVLDTEPTGDVAVMPTAPSGLTASPDSLTFTRSNWDDEQTFTVTAVQDDDLADAADLEITHEVTGYGSVTTADAVMVDVTDDDRADITVTPTTFSINEEGTATYTVVLDFQPSSDVTVTLTQPTNTDVTADTDTSTTSVNDTDLTFTSSNWNTAQTVTVSVADDADRTNETATITHAATQSGTTDEYNGITVDSVTVNVNDNDVITLSVSSLTVEEGGSGTTYTVVLARAPTGNVTVSLSASSAIGLTFDTDPAVGVQSTPLMFTADNWNSAQTVTITATQDADGFDNTGTITHTVTGGGLSGTSSLSTTVDDDEAVKLVFGGSASDGDDDGDFEMTVTEGTDSGSSNRYTVKLSSQPFPTDQNVTVEVTAPAGLLTLKKAGQSTATKTVDLRFTGTNWDTAQTVTVVADDDDDSFDAMGIPVAHMASGANFGSVSEAIDFTVTDDESPNLVPSKTTIDIDETDATVTTTYTVKLATQPSSIVTVTIDPATPM